MREIKFRAWDGGRKKYYGEGYSYGTMEWYDDMVAWRFNHFESDETAGEIILEQYTGLKDKNGREIYEGDMIAGALFGKTTDVLAVVFENKTASFVLTKQGWAFAHYFHEAINGDECEVIGNIHENPELLA